MREDLVKNIVDFFSRYGIDGYLVLNLVALVICLIYSRDIKRWKEIETWEQMIIICSCTTTIIMTLFTALRLIGVIPK